MIRFAWVAIRRAVATGLLVLVAGHVQAQSATFPGVAVSGIAAGPEIPFRLYRPDGAGPFPAMVLVHSCAGLNRHTDTWGTLLSSWGYLVVAPDSFGPRGVKQVCTTGAITASQRLPDVAGALKYLADRADVRADRIGLIGHSHGASTVVRAVQAANDLAARGVRAAVAYYPSCSTRTDRTVDIPLLVLIGEKDDWTPAARCRQLQAAGFSRPDLVEIVYYPDAFHAFEADRPDRVVPGNNGHVHQLGFDAQAASDAEARTRAFLQQHLR